MQNAQLSPIAGPLASAAAAALFSLAAGHPAFAAPAAGTLSFIQGSVHVRSTQGALRNGATGAVVETGETIETGTGRAQLRMVDGAYISLQPDTVLTLDNYTLASSGTPEAGFMSLLRGGMRTITGLIGRTQRTSYRLTTPTATLGIRGTEFLVTTRAPDPLGASAAGSPNSAIDTGTRVRVTGGAVEMCANGCFVFTSGQTGFVPDARSAPVRTSQAPSVRPAPAPLPQEVPFVAAETRTGTGESVAIAQPVQAVPTGPTPLPSGPGNLGVAYAASSPSPFGAFQRNPGQAIQIDYDASGAMTGYTDSNPGYYLGASQVAESNADGIIAWGRWTFASASIASYAYSIYSLQYYATTATQSPSIPIVQAYASFASTAPVLTDASSGALLMTGVTNSVTGTININFPGTTGGTANYALSVPLAGQVFTAAGTASQLDTTSFAGPGIATSTGSGCPCYNAMGGNMVQGTVTGTGNTRVGLNYGFSTTLGGMYGGNISGTVVFK